MQSTIKAIEKADRLRHQTCDAWGHLKPCKAAMRYTIVELCIWFLIVSAALAMLAMFGGIKL